MRVSPASASVAVTAAPMSTPAAVFSAMLRVTFEELNTGALLVSVLVRPTQGGSDSLESPSSLVALTRTSYSVSATRLEMVVVVVGASFEPETVAPLTRQYTL